MYNMIFNPTPSAVYHLTTINAFSSDVLDLGSFLKAFLHSYCHLVVKKVKHTYCDKTSFLPYFKGALE